MDLTVSVLLLVAAVAVIYYWVDFFKKGSVHVVKDDWYIRFQKAFPPADLWMAACAVVGSVGILTEHAYGLLFALLAAGGLIFLGLMDVTFNIQNRLYRLLATSNEMRFELLVNLLTLALGIIVIAYSWPRLTL